MKYLILILLLLLLFSQCEKVEEPISGCTECDATNFNPLANVNRNTCTYGTFVHIKYSQDFLNRLDESTAYDNLRIWFVIKDIHTFTKQVLTPKDTTQIDTIFVSFDDQKTATLYTFIGNYYNRLSGKDGIFLNNNEPETIIF